MRSRLFLKLLLKNFISYSFVPSPRVRNTLACYSLCRKLEVYEFVMLPIRYEREQDARIHTQLRRDRCLCAGRPHHR